MSCPEIAIHKTKVYVEYNFTQLIYIQPNAHN